MQELMMNAFIAGLITMQHYHTASTVMTPAFVIPKESAVGNSSTCGFLLNDKGLVFLLIPSIHHCATPDACGMTNAGVPTDGRHSL
jgi:hypothetical protein